MDVKLIREIFNEASDNVMPTSEAALVPFWKDADMHEHRERTLRFARLRLVGRYTTRL